LDFEFCNVVVYYDLPWNPMRVEQRIGRVDRFGQTHEKIFVHYFHCPGTIETDILERLYRRIRVFEQSIGELEPILRDELDYVQRIALDPNLSDEERAEKARQHETALAEKMASIDHLSEAAGQLAGIDHLLIDGFEDDRRRGRYIGAAEMAGYLSRWDRRYLKSYEAMASHRYAITTLACEPNVWGAAVGRGTVRRRLDAMARAADWISTNAGQVRTEGPLPANRRRSVVPKTLDVRVVEEPLLPPGIGCGLL
jgi:superfamily II DNA/RNA helicase